MTSSTPPVVEPPAGTVPLTGAPAVKAVRSAFSSPIATVVVMGIAILWTIPTFGLFVNSFRSKADAATTGWWNFFAHPSFSLSGYHDVMFNNGGMVLPLVNSLAITIPATIIPIFIASMAGYALAWLRFRGSDALFFFLFALQVVPLQMALVPLQQFYVHGAHIGGLTIIPSLNLQGSLAQIWLSHTMFSLPLAIFLLHNFIAQLPGSLIEAARVDGASHLRIFQTIVLPLSMPAITARMQSLVGNFGAHQELLAPAGFITIVIPLIVFLSLQRFFVRGLLAGSVKG